MKFRSLSPALFVIFLNVIPATAQEAGFDPQKCLNSIKSKGLEVCPRGDSPTWPVCDLSNPSIHASCTAPGTYYAPMQQTLVVNPDRSQVKMFPRVADMENFLKANPGWSAISCYCCCA